MEFTGSTNCIASTFQGTSLLRGIILSFLLSLDAAALSKGLCMTIYVLKVLLAESNTRSESQTRDPSNGCLLFCHGDFTFLVYACQYVCQVYKDHREEISIHIIRIKYDQLYRIAGLLSAYWNEFCPLGNLTGSLWFIYYKQGFSTGSPFINFLFNTVNTFVAVKCEKLKISYMMIGRDGFKWSLKDGATVLHQEESSFFVKTLKVWTWHMFIYSCWVCVGVTTPLRDMMADKIGYSDMWVKMSFCLGLACVFTWVCKWLKCFHASV